MDVQIIQKNLQHGKQTIPYEYSMSTIWGLDHTENKHTLYCGKDCMKKFCDSLKEHAKNIILFEKKKNVTINKEELKGKSVLYLWKSNTRKVW